MTCNASISSTKDVRRFLQKSLGLRDRFQQNPSQTREEDATRVDAAKKDAPAGQTR